MSSIASSSTYIDKIYQLCESVVNLKPGDYIILTESSYRYEKLSTFWCYVPMYYTTNNELLAKSIFDLKNRILGQLYYVDGSVQQEKKDSLIRLINSIFEKKNGDLSKS